MPKVWSELQSDDDAITLLRDWVAQSPLAIEILPPTPESARHCLESLQVTTRSALGAVAYHTGGLLVDHGWLRVLGSGHPRLPRAIDTWNELDGVHRSERGLLVADDILGGVFGWFSEPRTIHYLAPDTLIWEDLELGYSDWLAWALTNRLQQFYQDSRWPEWVDEVSALTGDQAIHVSPPLFAKGPPIAQRSRRAVPVDELWAFVIDAGKQLRELPKDAPFRIKIVD